MPSFSRVEMISTTRSTGSYLAHRAELGSTSHHPRWAFAFKFPPRKEISRVLKIVPSVGRTGAVTPIAMLRPVELGGVTVSRASLHNREEVARKDIREGDRVRVQRAGDVIPQVLERLKEPGRRRGRRWRMPDACPSCGFALVERGPFTVCQNSFDCPAQPTVPRSSPVGSSTSPLAELWTSRASARRPLDSSCRRAWCCTCRISTRSMWSSSPSLRGLPRSRPTTW
jgi:hypothetical protein